MFKTNFSGHDKFGVYDPSGYGSEGILMIKVLPKELSETMNHCIHIVNFVEERALN